MDDEFQDLEAELRRLQPVRPARTLVQRIAIELEGVEEAAISPAVESGEKAKRRSVSGLPWLILPIAAAITLALVVPHGIEGNMPVVKALAGGKDAVPAFKPVAAQNVLVSSRDEGYVTMADGTTARRVRQTYVDTITWKNPRTNASLTWSVPREEVRVTPISYE